MPCSKKKQSTPQVQPGEFIQLAVVCMLLGTLGTTLLGCGQNGEKADSASDKGTGPPQIAMRKAQLGTGNHTAGSDKNCTEVFEVARDVVQDYMRELETADPTDPDIQKTTGWVWQLENKILNTEKGAQTMQLMDDLLDRTSLNTGTWSGHIWTETDNTLWAQCNIGGGNEEDDSSHTCQGDQFCAGGNLLQIEGKNMSIRSFLALAAKRNWKWAPNTWPINNGAHEVPYCYDQGVTQQVKDAMRAAMDQIEEQVPCVRFKPLAGTVAEGQQPYLTPPAGVPRVCSEIPSVLITSQLSGCASEVGMLSGVAPYETISQIINMGEGCESLGIAAHELLHTMGLIHEMSRTDRNAYVAIEQQNLAAGIFESQFQIKDFAIWNQEVFDFNSIMMYGSWTFSKNGLQTIVPIRDIRLSIWLGQRMGLSQMDVEKLGTLYGCMDQISPLTPNKNLSEAYVRGDQLDGHFEGEVCADHESTDLYDHNSSLLTCTDLQTHCAHETLGKLVRSKCPVTCFLCIPGLGNTPAPMAETTIAPSEQVHRRRRSSHAYRSTRPGLWRYTIMAFFIFGAILNTDSRN